MSNKNKVHGILARFESPGALLQAAEKIKDAGYEKFDCHSPFVIHGMDQAMGLKRSPLGYIVAVGGFFGFSGGLLLQWWVASEAYALVISGKPFFSLPAFIIVAFELTILFSAFATFFGMLRLNGLPKLFNPLFNSDNFGKFSDDGFFVSVESADPKFDAKATKSFLDSIGSKQTEVVNA